MVASTELNEVKAKDDLINLLEFEIVRMHQEDAKPGWTTWALVGSIATILWVALKELQDHAGKIELNHVLYCLVFFAVAWEALVDIKNMVLPWPTSRRVSRFWHSHAILGGARLQMLGYFLWYGCLLMVTIVLPIIPQKFAFWMAVIVLSSNVVAVLGGFTASYVSFPFSPLVGGKGAMTVGLVLKALIGIVLISALMGSLLSLPWSISVEEVKVGLLAFSESLLLLRLLELGTQNPFLSTLTDVRRLLGLGQIDYKVAKKQTEIALRGMDASEVLRPHIESILSMYRQIAVIQKAAFNELTALAACLPEGEVPLTDQQKTLMDSVLKSTDQKVDAACRLMVEVSDGFKRFDKRIKNLTIWFPQASTDIQQSVKELREKLEEVSQEIIEPSKEIKNQMHRFQQLIIKGTSGRHDSANPPS